MTRILPVCSTTNSRPLLSPECVTKTGRDRPRAILANVRWMLPGTKAVGVNPSSEETPGSRMAVSAQRHGGRHRGCGDRCRAGGERGRTTGDDRQQGKGKEQAGGRGPRPTCTHGISFECVPHTVTRSGRGDPQGTRWTPIVEFVSRLPALRSVPFHANRPATGPLGSRSAPLPGSQDSCQFTSRSFDADSSLQGSPGPGSRPVSALRRPSGSGLPRRRRTRPHP